MQEIAILLWDDKIRAETGEKVPATEVRFLGYGQKRRRLDLSEGKAAELDALLAAWLDAGQEEDARPAVARFGPGSRESRDFHRDLRLWADGEGRSEEYTVKHRPGTVVKKVQYVYPDRLVRDFEDHLVSRAVPAA